MTTWHFDQDEPLVDDAFGQAWQNGHLEGWDFGALNEEDLWDGDGVHDVPSAASSSPPPLLPRNTSNTYHPRAADTIFPPPHEFVARPSSSHHPRVTLPHLPHSQTNPVTSRAIAAPSPAREHLAPLPPLGGFGYIVDHLFDDLALPVGNSSPTPSDHSADFVTLEQSASSEPAAADMAPVTGRRAAERRSGLVDLTSGSSSQEGVEHPARRGVKRAAEGSAARASKRRTQGPLKIEKIDLLDLVNKAPSAEDELRQQQQREAIRAQQAAQKDKEPQRIGQRQCIICMENYTNATVTSCGHFFCHECLTQALMAGEKSSERGVGACPVCRKPLSRKKKNEIIPIAFMKKDQFAKNQSKRRDILT